MEEKFLYCFDEPVGELTQCKGNMPVAQSVMLMPMLPQNILTLVQIPNFSSKATFTLGWE